MIGHGLFGNCDSLVSIKIPNGVEYIGIEAFGYCDVLSEVIIPDSLTVIELWAFSGCVNLQSLTLPANISSIGMGSFDANTKLKCAAGSLTAVTLTKAGYVFEIIESEPTYNSVLKLPAAIKVIDAEAFMGMQADRVILPDGATTIGARAFANCDSLLRIDIPATVTSIAADAFNGCANVTIYAPAGSYAESYAAENGIDFASASK